jgi:Fe(3+) dicitrate transport protein
VDVDQFHSYTSELRLRHRYQWGALPATLVTGLQLMRNNLHRSQLGKGTSGTDFDLTLSQPGWGRNLHFITKNIAFFAENRLLLSPRFSLSPGIWLEGGQSNMSGKISYYQAQQLPNTIKHRFPLLGINADYEWRAGHNLYAGFSQAYRPVIFKDIIPASTFERADKNLQDATGYNLEAGYRGQQAAFTWDISFFQLRYNNRLGNLMQTDAAGEFYILRTNTGNSLTWGLEFFTEYQQQLSLDWHFSAFTSTSVMQARYLQAQVRQGNENVSIKGNQVEGVPRVISRNGMNCVEKQVFSYVF